MCKSNVKFTKDNEYYTPRKTVDFFRKLIYTSPQIFNYDPATTKEKAKEFKIENFDTIETDGLLKDWTVYKNIWINPPFTKKHLFLRKAWETFTETNGDIFILFPIEFLTTKRFSDIGCKGTIYIPNGRINFQSGLGKKGKSPAFGSVVMKLGYTNDILYINKEEII